MLMSLLNNGMVNCFNLTGPFPLTLMVQPVNTGTIDFNTLKLKNFPWTGNYFGNMENIMEAKADSGYTFVEWQNTAGNVITPSKDSVSAAITITQDDTLIAVFASLVGVQETNDYGVGFTAYPNVVNTELNVEYVLEKTMNIDLKLYSVFGVETVNFPELSGRKTAGTYKEKLNVGVMDLAPGVYYLHFRADDFEQTTKILVTE